MDVFFGMGVEAIKWTIWTIGLSAGVVAFIASLPESKRDYVRATARAVFTASLAFLIVTVLAMFTIVSQPTDRRWSEGKKPLLEANEIGKDSFFKDLVAPLNDMQKTAIDAANNVIAFENAFATLPEFLIMALWAAGVAAVVGVPMAVVFAIQKKRLVGQVRKLKSTVKDLNGAVQELQREKGVPVLPDVKW